MALTQVNPAMLSGSTNSTTTIQSNGTTAITINSSQNVGVGTTSPTAKLHVYGGSNNQFKVESSGAEANFTLAGTSYGQFENSVGDLYITNDASANMIFRTASTERMRVSSDGNLYIGRSDSPLNGTKVLGYTEANQSALTAWNNYGSNGNDIVLIRAGRNTTAGNFNAFAYYNDGAGQYKFQIYDSGSAYNRTGTYGTISDIKLKENIVDATPKLDEIAQLKVRNFNFIGEELKQIGFVAQEFEEVFPSMVEETEDKTPNGELLGTTTKQIKTAVLIPILVKAIQELKAEIDQLKAQLAPK